MIEYVQIECINKQELLEELYKIDEGFPIDISTREMRDIIRNLPVIVVKTPIGRSKDNA